MATEGGEDWMNDSFRRDFVALLTLEVETLALAGEVTHYFCKAEICFFLVEAIKQHK